MNFKGIATLSHRRKDNSYTVSIALFYDWFGLSRLTKVTLSHRDHVLKCLT